MGIVAAVNGAIEGSANWAPRPIVIRIGGGNYLGTAIQAIQKNCIFHTKCLTSVICYGKGAFHVLGRLF